MAYDILKTGGPEWIISSMRIVSQRINIRPRTRNIAEGRMAQRERY